MRVHWRLREIAEPERWNPRKLSLTTGLGYQTVWSIWHDRATRVDLTTLAALATTLEVTPGDLLILDPQSLSPQPEAEPPPGQARAGHRSRATGDGRLKANRRRPRSS